VIAAVNGAAAGLGATLALFCDIVVASDLAHFSDPHVKVGLVAGDGSSVIWPMLIGIARAKEFLFTADRIGAADAVRLGLVNHAVAADELTKFTLALAAKIASQPAFATRATKASVNRQLRRAVNDGMDVGAAWQQSTRPTRTVGSKPRRNAMPSSPSCSRDQRTVSSCCSVAGSLPGSSSTRKWSEFP